MALFNDSYQEVSIDWLTLTLKYDNHGGGQAMLLTQGSWNEDCAIGLCAYGGITWT